MQQLLARLRGWLAFELEEEPIVAPAPSVPPQEIFRRFWPYARKYQAWLLLTLPFIALGPAIEAATIWIFKVLVDEVLVPADFGPLGRVALVYLGLTVLGGLVAFLDDYLSTLVAGKFLLSLRTALFRHLSGLSLDFFERRPLGDVLARLTGDISSIESLLLSGVAKLVAYVFRIVFFAGALFYLRWDLALVSFIVTPLFWVAARRFSARIKEASRERRRRSGSISAVAEESLSNIALIQAYNRQAMDVERFHRHNLASFAAQMASTRLKALFSPLVDLVELAGLLVVVGVGTWELSQGRLTVGGLLVFLAYLSKLYSPVRGLSRMSNTVYAASASAERVVELLDQRPSVVERPGAIAIGRARGLVELQGASFRYPGAHRDALRDVWLRVEPGQVLALVGPSGAGKTTLAKLLLRFYDPVAGQLLLDGYDLRDLTLESLRENVAALLQETLVFDGTIRDNIAYGRLGATEEEVVRAAQAADAHEFILSLPSGYDEIVGQKGRRLSGGQRQRVAIARAMIRDAPVLILDEPTTGLDAESGWRVLEALRRLMRGRTTIIISHNLMTVREATMIAVLEGGRIVERGGHEELLAAGGRYARLYQRHHPDGLARVDGFDGLVRQAVER